MKERETILETEWPDPLVPLGTIMATAPWIKPPLMNRLAFAPPRLIDIATLVTTQENACRFCYGTQHTMMRLSGYSEEQIRSLVARRAAGRRPDPGSREPLPQTGPVYPPARQGGV